MGRFIIIFFAVFLYASNIINISYFPNDTKLDILFSLDTPFKGKIYKVAQNEYKIENTSINRIEQKQFKNLKVIISPIDKTSTSIKFLYNSALSIKASVTAKGYGLRVRVLGVKTANTINLNTPMPPQTQPNNFNIINYAIVILILIILIIVLLIIKKKTLQKLPEEFRQDNYRLLAQRMIDPKNKIVLIEIFNRKYLLLLGEKNNVLLDKLSEVSQEELKDISSQKGFDSLLEEKLKHNDFIKNASRLKDFDGI